MGLYYLYLLPVKTIDFNFKNDTLTQREQTLTTSSDVTHVSLEPSFTKITKMNEVNKISIDIT